jgi:citrate synthase
MRASSAPSILPEAKMKQTAKLLLDGVQIDLPVIEGTEQERAVDISDLRSKTGYITLDDGYSNTGACRSNITYIDGEKGILRYHGIPIEQLAQYSNFAETAMLVIWGELPTESRLRSFRKLLADYEMIHEGLRNSFDGFPASAHPMAILSAMINTVSCYSPEVMSLNGENSFEEAAARLMSKVRTIAAAAYKSSVGQPIEYPKPELDYCANFLHMMFSIPNRTYEPSPEAVQALNLVMILHADHEQNCSTSTVRTVASAGANLFASCAAGVCALWGPLHGGANVAVIEMLEQIRREKISLTDYVARVKHKSSGHKLMGFGHRVYKNFDPRAVILKEAAEKLLAALHVNDPLLDIALKLEEVSLNDQYFIDRKLYPNVDFYSGIILRAIGIPVNMFTVMFAIARMPGWIAHWKEVHADPNNRISRPRQIYTGPAKRDYVRMQQR